MPLPRLIPCLDVAAGRVVKGINFTQMRDVGEPVELGALYSDAGADELVFLDVRATIDGRESLIETVRDVSAAIAIPFTVGGGIRTLDDAARMFEAGADKVSINTAACARPALITELAEVFGSQAVVVAIDVTGGAVRSHAGSKDAALNAIAWARECQERGAGELLVTSIDADGTRNGYDLQLMTDIAAATTIPTIASGGAGTAQHVADALGVASAALLASILHEDPARLRSLREELRTLGVHMRDDQGPDPAAAFGAQRLPTTKETTANAN
jgi:cyclase